MLLLFLSSVLLGELDNSCTTFDVAFNLVKSVFLITLAKAVHKFVSNFWLLSVRRRCLFNLSETYLAYYGRLEFDFDDADCVGWFWCVLASGNLLNTTALMCISMRKVLLTAKQRDGLNFICCKQTWSKNDAKGGGERCLWYVYSLVYFPGQAINVAIVNNNIIREDVPW